MPKLAALLLLSLTLLLTGCQAPTTSPFFNGVRAQWAPIRYTYNDYVDHDPRLTPDERAILKTSSATMDELIRREEVRLGSLFTPTTQP